MDDRLAAFRALIVDVYELAGLARRTSDRMAREVGQTAARWHVMSVVAGESTTVAGIARRLGQRRQGVQRIVSDLVDCGMLSLSANPDHARSPLVSLTPEGSRVLRELFDRSERPRIELLQRSGVTAAELAAARTVIRTLNAAFDRS